MYLCHRKTKSDATVSVALAAIAQLVEHFIRNEKVAGSSPARGSRKRPTASEGASFCLYGEIRVSLQENYN